MSNYACIVVRSISSICPLNSQYSTVYLVKKIWISLIHITEIIQ